MKHIFTRLSLVTSLLFVVFSAHAQGFTDKIDSGLDRGQSIGELERRAKEAMADENYYEAIILYQRILESDSTLVPAWKGFADAALAFSAFEAAESAYQKLVDLGMIGSDGGALFGLAEARFRQGKYEEAKEDYTRYLFEDKPADATPENIAAAQKHIQNCEWALQMKEEQDLELPVTLLDTTINTEYSEYSPRVLGDELYYSSYSFPFEKDKHNPKRLLVKVMKVDPGASDIKPEPVEFNTPDAHTMHVAYDKEAKVMIYTVGHYVTAHQIRGELWMRKSDGNGGWGPAWKLPANINTTGYTTTEPCIGWTNGDPAQVLFFVSDRPGGMGKRDIWYTRFRDTVFSDPVNLSTLNTSGDDVTPFYHSNTQTLYFSTDSRQTIGGFDIWSSVGDGAVWSEPQNMGMPINSSANDAFFSLTEKGNTAFFSSNRYGAQNISEEACCYDLFKADIERPQMVAITFDKSTGDSLSGTVMQLIELNDDGTPNEEIKVNVSGNNFSFPLQPNKHYVLIATKPGFKPDTVRFDTPKTIWKDVLVQKLYLEPAKVDLVALIYDKGENNMPLKGTTLRFIDLGPVKPLKNGDNEPKVVTEVNDLSNRYHYDLKFDHKYKLVVTKAGYTIDSVEFSTAGMTETTTIEKKLYIERGIDLLAKSYNEMTRKPLPGVTFRLVEIDPEGKPNGNRDDRYSDVNSNEYKTVLKQDKRYRIIASKDGFFSDSLDFQTTDLALLDFQTLTQELYLRPTDLDAYLPFSLYFDNDEPDKRTTATTTKTLYEKAYFAYYPRKEEFKRRYTEGMSEAATAIASEKLDTFFENEVRAGWNRLKIFTEVLYGKLKRGDKIEIKISGYASPRAASQYNKYLTARRIASVMNHFSQHDAGVLLPYFKNGQLQVTEIPAGEDQAPPGISDKINEERTSVYSLEASRERRVEIRKVEIEKKVLRK